MKIPTVVLRYAPTLISAIPALVAQATGWQVMAMDVTVHVFFAVL